MGTKLLFPGYVSLYTVIIGCALVGRIGHISLNEGFAAVHDHLDSRVLSSGLSYRFYPYGVDRAGDTFDDHEIPSVVELLTKPLGPFTSSLLLDQECRGVSPVLTISTG